MFSKIKGKKTYLVALCAGAAAAASAMGHPIPDWGLLLLNAAGLGAIRNAIQTPE
jgi:hypothetical protein